MKRTILIVVICLLLVFGTGFAGGAVWLWHGQSVNIRCRGTVDLVVVREGPGAIIASCPVPQQSIR